MVALGVEVLEGLGEPVVEPVGVILGVAVLK